MKRPLIVALAAFLVAAPLASHAAGSAPPEQALMRKLQWRSIGPYIGGRVVAVAGVPSVPSLFYMGAVQGGIWRSTNYGRSWTNISDGTLPRTATSIGALAVSASNPKIIYAGTGESDIRQDFDTGVGIFKSTDAGKSWHYAGLRATHVTTGLAIDPHDPNVVYAATMGHVFAPNPERGVYKTTDGGKHWTRVLYVDADTGANGVVMDRKNPSVLYAAMWQARRYPWKLVSGGPGSGLYKTTDGGTHWSRISANPGFARGILGKIGVSIVRDHPNVVYASVQAKHGGIFRSNDGGATWTRVNREMKLRQRAFYYTAIYADPVNPNVAYAPEVDGVFKTSDGGKTWIPLGGSGDHHIVWINPRNTRLIIDGNDGGATVSTDGGKTWSSENDQPTGQYYHVALDDRFPFHVYGAQQDEGAFEGPSASIAGAIPLSAWRTVALGESTFVAPEPGNPHVTYGSGYYSAFVRLNDRTGDEQNVSPWPRYISGSSAAENKYRFSWSHPIFFSPANPKELLLASQVVFSSTDRGETWSILSPDLTRNVKSTEGPSGGPVSLDQTGAEFFPDISALAVAPQDANVLWAGSGDGLVHVTTNHGARWTTITPPQLPQWAEITSIEPSHAHLGTAYLTASRYQWDDFHPYVYRTTDYGRHWTTIVNGLPADQYVFVVRQDPRQPNLLFAGTRSTVYVSFDRGTNWQPLTLNLPGAQVRDLAIDNRQGELVAATHGRAFWILDNLAFLEDVARERAPRSGGLQLFAPETAWLSHAYGGGAPPPNAGANPTFGATVFFNLPRNYTGKVPVTLSFEKADGSVVRQYTLHPKTRRPKLSAEQRANLDANARRARRLAALTTAAPGMNVFVWDLQYPPAIDVPGFRTVPTDDFPDNGDGPVVVPGSYRVVLRCGAHTLKAPLTVRLDPRLHPGAGDLDARLALGLKLRDTMNALDLAIADAMKARARLSPAHRSAVDREIGKLVQLDIHSSEADTMVTTKIREQLGFLANSLEDAYARPTAADEVTFAHLRADALAGEAILHRLTAH